MKDKNQEHSTDAVWVQMCLADDLDPQKRMASRLAILRHAEAQDCTLYRPDDEDESDDAEELDLGDARILFTGLFQAPATIPITFKKLATVATERGTDCGSNASTRPPGLLSAKHLEK